MHWYPPLDWIDYTHSTFYADLKWDQYLLTFYTSALSLGLNEMGPVNEGEMLFCFISLMISLVVNSNLFGEMAVLIATISKKKTLQQHKVDISNTVMNSICLSNENQDLIREYLNKTQYNKDKQEEFDQFLEQISPSLKVRVQNKLFQEELEKNDVIQ